MAMWDEPRLADRISAPAAPKPDAETNDSLEWARQRAAELASKLESVTAEIVSPGYVPDPDPKERADAYRYLRTLLFSSETALGNLRLKCPKPLSENDRALVTRLENAIAKGENASSSVGR